MSYWPLDYDPAVKKAFPQGWRDFKYIVVTQDMLDTLEPDPYGGRGDRSFAGGGQLRPRHAKSIQVRAIEPARWHPSQHIKVAIHMRLLQFPRRGARGAVGRCLALALSDRGLRRLRLRPRLAVQVVKGNQLVDAEG